MVAIFSNCRISCHLQIIPYSKLHLHTKEYKNFNNLLDLVWTQHVFTYQCNTDTKVFGCRNLKDNRGWVDEPLYQIWCQ